MESSAFSLNLRSSSSPPTLSSDSLSDSSCLCFLCFFCFLCFLCFFFLSFFFFFFSSASETSESELLSFFLCFFFFFFFFFSTGEDSLLEEPSSSSSSSSNEPSGEPESSRLLCLGDGESTRERDLRLDVRRSGLVSPESESSFLVSLYWTSLIVSAE